MVQCTSRDEVRIKMRKKSCLIVKFEGDDSSADYIASNGKTISE